MVFLRSGSGIAPGVSTLGTSWRPRSKSWPRSCSILLAKGPWKYILNLTQWPSWTCCVSRVSSSIIHSGTPMTRRMSSINSVLHRKPQARRVCVKPMSRQLETVTAGSTYGENLDGLRMTMYLKKSISAKMLAQANRSSPPSGAKMTNERPKTENLPSAQCSMSIEMTNTFDGEIEENKPPPGPLRETYTREDCDR